MNTAQLMCILNCDNALKCIEKNVLAADQLPKMQLHRFPCAYIVNTDPSNMRGKHWVAFYFNENKNGEFFDSYGHSPGHYNRTFLDFLQRNGRKYLYNHKMLQSVHSELCGQFCIFYLMHKVRGYSMQEIISRLSFEYNDNYVYEFINGAFYMCFSSSVYCTVKQICQSLL